MAMVILLNNILTMKLSDFKNNTLRAYANQSRCQMEIGSRQQASSSH